MSLLMRLYRLWLRLYPTAHRQTYGSLMLRHAEDLVRDARRRGSWRLIQAIAWLAAETAVNAGRERWEELMDTPHRLHASSWLSVALAAWPGLWIALTRYSSEPTGPVLSFLGYGYLALVLVALPMTWWRQRRFPVWGLLPAGFLLWLGSFSAGNVLAEPFGPLGRGGRIDSATGQLLVEIVLIAILLVTLVRDQRLSRDAWLTIGLLIGLALVTAGVALEGLLFFCAGLWAARRHGAVATLVGVGGYAYLCLDRDYLFGAADPGWMGLPVYLTVASAVLLMVTPIALLRARSWLSQFLALLVPVGVFTIARLVAANLVLGRPLAVSAGELAFSLMMATSLGLAAIVYRRAFAANADPSGNVNPAPLT